jgi:hypothetical protein
MASRALDTIKPIATAGAKPPKAIVKPTITSLLACTAWTGSDIVILLYLINN